MASGLHSSNAANTLLVIFDANVHYWAQPERTRSETSSFIAVTEQLLSFIHSYLLCSRQNFVVFIMADSKQSKILYPVDDSQDPHSSAYVKLPPSTIISCIFDQIKSFIASSLESEEHSNSLISTAFSLGLCSLNRISKCSSNVASRILIVYASEDSPPQYVPIMNCIFSAQKKEIPVDVCCLTESRSSFMEQTANLTGGLYVSPPEDGILQCLLTTLLPSPQTRSFLRLQSQMEVDLRATCFCHNRFIDIGFVCSVCLSVFCVSHSVCPTCTNQPIP